MTPLFNYLILFLVIFICIFIFIYFYFYSHLFWISTDFSPHASSLASLSDLRSLLLLSLFALPLGASRPSRFTSLEINFRRSHRVLTPDSARRITNPGLDGADSSEPASRSLEEALNDYFARRPLVSSPGIGPARLSNP
jgi:hypothetical protein